MADISGSITSGGNAQIAATFNPRRRGLLIQVPSSEETIWISFGGTAASVSPAIELPAGESIFLGREFQELIVRPISIFGATTGKKFTMFDGEV